MAAQGEDSNTEEPETVEIVETEEDQDSEHNNPYSYIAQPGDSYTKIARKAVQTYGINNNVQLSEAQIIVAETFITNEAGSPKLLAGESVVISEEIVKSATDRAADLDETTQARWERYVKFVNFNTDNVGESR